MKVEFRILLFEYHIRGDFVFYDRYVYLCKMKGVSPSRAAVDAGISKSLVTKWKVNNTKIPSADVIGKLSSYFAMPVSELLGEENNQPATGSGARTVSDDDIKFALFGDGEITDEMLEEVRNFAAYVKSKNQLKPK